MALVLTIQTCGGSGGSSAPKSDASPGGKDAAKDAALDSDVMSSRDSTFGVDSVSTDDAGEDAVARPEVGAIDVLNEDIGLSAYADAKDIPPSSLIDMAADQGMGSWDNAAEASPAIGALDAPTTDLGDDASTEIFSCGSRDTRDSGVVQELCYDFSDSASAADFNPEAGTWAISDGRYNATGPSTQVTCPGGVDGGSGMIASVLGNLSAQNVRVHAKMTSVKAPDKVLVLRSRSGGNRIELNFVANFTYDGADQGGALNISELADCVNTTYVAANTNTVQVPHAIGQAIVVDVQLIGQHLTVVVDGRQVFDNTLPVSTVAGSVGFAVFRDAETEFDDFRVEVLM